MPNDNAALPAVATTAPALFTPRDEFELAQRKAKLYASSTLVPQDFRDNVANCLIAMNMARRIGADDLQVMQNLYVVHGKPGWSAQFLIAAFNQSGKFSALRYEWQGKQGDKDGAWGCRAYAIERATGERIEGPWVTWKMVEAEGWSKKSGSKWLTIPDLMFHYRAAAFFIRTHAPEIAMGLQTVEEIGDIIDVTPEPESRPSRVESLKEALREQSKEETEQRAAAETPSDHSENQAA